MKVRAILIAAAAVLCLAGCGSSDDSKADGIVSLSTTTSVTEQTSGTSSSSTTTAAATTKDKKSTTTTKKTTAKATTTTKKTTKATTTAKKTTTQAAATAQQTQTQAAQNTEPATARQTEKQTEKQTEQQTQATQKQTEKQTEKVTEAPEPTGPDLSTFKGKASFIYRDAEFSVGDNINDIKSKLGNEAAPMQEAPNCLTGEVSPLYSYAGLEIETDNSGKIIAARLSEMMYEGREGKLAVGIKLGSTLSDFKKEFGEPIDVQFDMYYIFKSDGLTVTVSALNGGEIDFIEVKADR